MIIKRLKNSDNNSSSLFFIRGGNYCVVELIVVFSLVQTTYVSIYVVTIKMLLDWFYYAPGFQGCFYAFFSF